MVHDNSLLLNGTQIVEMPVELTKLMDVPAPHVINTDGFELAHVA